MTSHHTLEEIEAEQPVTCKVSELSQLSGIKKQVLRRYDRIGLLHPEMKLESGWHLYTRRDLIQLEQLGVMRMLGLSRAEIKECLSSDDRDLREELRLQRKMLMEKRRRIDHVIYFLEHAEEVNRDPHCGDWHYLGKVVEALQRLMDPEYFKRSYLQGHMREESAPDMQVETQQHLRLLKARD